MFAMKGTSMTACANTAFQLVAGCAALNTLAAVNSEHTGHLAKVVEMLCNDCKKECDKFPKITECKTCGDACLQGDLLLEDRRNFRRADLH
jgi:Cys-rich four helix bundle protein (predicted Tat secretion target)